MTCHQLNTTLLTRGRGKKSGQWYSCLKRITSHDQHKNDQPSVGEISHLSDQEQVELIADQFAKIQNEYQPLENDDVSVPPFSESDVPKFTPAQVWFTLIKINTNKSTVSGDFPAKLIKLFAAYIAEPFTDILNTNVRCKKLTFIQGILPLTTWD